MPNNAKVSHVPNIIEYGVREGKFHRKTCTGDVSHVALALFILGNGNLSRLQWFI